jgi:hypothetical protein
MRFIRNIGRLRAGVGGLAWAFRNTSNQRVRFRFGSGRRTIRMNKHLPLGFGLVVAIVVLVLLNARNPKTDDSSSGEAKTSSLLRAEAVPQTVHGNNASIHSEAPEVLETGSTNADFTKPRILPVPSIQTVTHSGSDFAWGECSNTVAKGHVQLSAAAFAGAVQDGSLVSGTYLSARHLGHRSFDTITVGREGEFPSGSALKFEIRMLDKNNEWSGWQEINPDAFDKPFAVEELASGWQYQVTFCALSPEASPRLYSVTITTQKAAQEGGLEDTSTKDDLSATR